MKRLIRATEDWMSKEELREHCRADLDALVHYGADAVKNEDGSFKVKGSLTKKIYSLYKEKNGPWVIADPHSSIIVKTNTLDEAADWLMEN